MNGALIAKSSHVKFLGKEMNSFNLADNLTGLILQPDWYFLQVWQIIHVIVDKDKSSSRKEGGKASAQIFKQTA